MKRKAFFERIGMLRMTEVFDYQNIPSNEEE
jgi:hypothetical protein